MKPRNILNENDISAYKNLAKIWKVQKAILGINQTDFAEDHLNWTQGNFSQYITGQVRIGDKALTKLCTALNCKPWDIREELKDTETSLQLDNHKVAFEIMQKSILSCDNVPASIMASYKESLELINAEEYSEQSVAA
jgi:DNA-binding Xre family transcriptional regulator